MTNMHPLGADQQVEWLQEAAGDRVPLTINYPGVGAWATLKSRLLRADRAGDLLVILYPYVADGPQPEIVVGESLGVAFRRGHEKCVFESQVISRTNCPMGGGIEAPVLEIAWPDSVHELQRRLFSRTRVPPRVVIPVDVARCEPAADKLGQSARGVVLDLSAGGISVALPEAKGPRWRAGDILTCSFALESGRSVQKVTGTLRHCDKTPDGRWRLGLQFVGLETSASGRRTIESIARVASRFRRQEIPECR
ncbi:MAG TPA: PilZ domain-containing protein [Phycisphaerae bacterium]|nr:PilZ domain-containing protein [Phycisphaerae bacterium]HRY66978.1 PilZ domain-containing protein [Phycisphaerae bacterium]HSA29556.1 PilZ domain-containing protein [Phycisphaerae bacterium]